MKNTDQSNSASKKPAHIPSEKDSVIMADDLNGRRKNPGSQVKHGPSTTSTDRAAMSPRVSTVTDGEAG